MHLVISLFMLLFIAFPFSASAENPFRFGVILVLSGEMSTAGSGCRNAMQIALDKLDPALQNRINLIFEDDKLQPALAVAAYRKLRSVDNIQAVLTFGSGSSNAVAPLAESDGIPMIAIASDFKIVRDRSKPFLLWVSPAEEVKVLVREMKRRGYRRIASIVATQDGMLSISRELDHARGSSFDVVVHEEVPGDMRDFRPFLSKLRTYTGIDAVFVALMPGQSGIFAKQARQRGIQIPLFNAETFEEPDDVKTSEGALFGAWYVQADDPDSGFLETFRKKYPDSSQFSAANCHDAVMLASEAVRQKKPLDVFLASLKDFSGALGTYSATGDHRFTLPATVKVVTENGFVKQSVQD